MKKIFPMMAAMGMILSLTACGITGNLSAGSLENGSAGSEMETASTGTSETEASIETEEEALGSNILVAYFSWADNAILADDVDAVASPSVISPGNVQQLAGWVQEETGGGSVFDPGHRPISKRLG